jgi:hypothetical protein
MAAVAWALNRKWKKTAGCPLFAVALRFSFFP